MRAKKIMARYNVWFKGGKMRTRTNFAIGNGSRGFQNHLKNSFPAGNAVIVFEDKALASEIFSKMDPALYKVKLLGKGEWDKQLPESSRFIIGAGGSEVMEKVKKISGDRSFCFYASHVDYRCFTPYAAASGEQCGYAEFVYFDEASLSLRNNDALARAYLSAFTVLTECVLSSYYERGLPYIDRGLTGIISGLKSFLISGTDVDKFYTECLRLIKMGAEYLTNKNVVTFFNARALKIGNLGQEYGFAVDYFVNLLALNFTKWNFFDMLIPAERLINGVSALKPNYRGEAGELLLTREDLSKITLKVKNLTVLPKTDAKTILEIISASAAEDTPLIAEIYNRGILEGLISYG